MTGRTDSLGPAAPTAGPISSAERIASLDTIRGVAVLGILLMNALSFGLDDAAYSNLEAGGVETVLDVVIELLVLLFVDQKMMGLFSLLFGVGVVIFAERAEARGRRVVALSLWRFTLLLAVGVGLLTVGSFGTLTALDLLVSTSDAVALGSVWSIELLGLLSILRSLTTERSR